MSDETDSGASVAKRLAGGILRVAARAKSEEDLRIGTEGLLKKALDELGIDVSPRYEKSYAPKGSILRGRSDAVYGHVVIEYEPVAKLRSPAGVRHAADQLDHYLQAELAHEKESESAPRVVGIGLDGEQIFFLRYKQGTTPTPTNAIAVPTRLPLFPDLGGATQTEPEARYQIIGPFAITEDSMKTCLLYLRALRKRSLTPESLAQEFGPKGGVAREIVAALYRALLHTDHPQVKTFFAEWDRLFGIVYGQELAKATKAAQELGTAYGLADPPELKPLLFAVHTYYALLMKLLAAELLSLQSGSFMSSLVTDLASAKGKEITRRLADIENGGLFARLGVRNFLEGDFFGWYLNVWDGSLESGVRELARALSDFEPATGSLEPNSTRDLLKKLYQYLVPRKLRHDLGEYYTPDWLAELTLDESGYDGAPGKRILDPACGSGTFLVLAIRRARANADAQLQEPAELVRGILDSIVGFDLNPLAVIAARTNYLLALGTLVRHATPLDIPVYLCDSVLAPSSDTLQGTFSEDYTIPSTVGDFHMPRAVVDNGHLPRLTALLEEAVDVNLDSTQFVKRVIRQIGSLDSFATTTVSTLYAKILQLERDGRDGLWARIIKNAFAPVFNGTFDFVIGNPPWVRWGYLADSYRKATLRLWTDYGLFSLRGAASRLGGGEKDFSMLFLYASADRYLAEKGVLSFVITQEVLKGKGAGEGFRRFRLGTNGAKLRVRRAHDLVSLAPFEGAANKTAILVLEKGGETTYPVPYTMWSKKKGVGSLDTSLTLTEVEAQTNRRELLARPIGSNANGSWQTLEKDREAGLSQLRGSPDYKARRGASTEPYGVFWLQLTHVRSDGLLVVDNLPELGKRDIPKTSAAIEPDLVYPAVRGRDIQRWAANPQIYVLISQDPRTREGYPDDRMKTQWPKTYAYLKRFRQVLLTRGSRTVRELAERTVFWSMYGIGTYTFAPFRVVWRRMHNDLVASVISTSKTPFGERPVIGTDTTSFIAVENAQEAHYLCALLNSAPSRAFVKSFSSAGRGFGAPSIVKNMALPAFSSGNKLHVALAGLSARAHDVSGVPTRASELVETERAIDSAAAELWKIPAVELLIIREGLK